MSAEGCVFCKIIEGAIPSYRLWESERFVVFLDIGPVQPGHALVVPKVHAETLFDMPPEFGEELLAVLQRVGKALMQGLGAEGLNVVQNNFSAAGQVVPHAHWHLIPRRQGDGCALWPQGKALSPEAACELLAKVQTHL